MPELPEVETVKRGLEQHIIGKTVEDVLLRRADLRTPFPPLFAQQLQGLKVLRLRRRAKYILIDLSEELVWLIHLGMSGSVRLVEHDDAPLQLKKHDHVVVRLSDGLSMIYHDPRRFGLMSSFYRAEEPTHPLLAHLGVEPLEDDFTAAYLQRVLAKKTIPIKQALMDQQVVVGVGNIYASEALFRSQIHPQRAANMCEPELEALVVAVKDVLREAIASGGSTLRDYVNAVGDSGYFQHHFDVYGREHQPCTRCAEPIKRITQAGRSTFFCGVCQRLAT